MHVEKSSVAVGVCQVAPEGAAPETARRKIVYTFSKRQCLFGFSSIFSLGLVPKLHAAEAADAQSATSLDVYQLQTNAMQAYARRDFKEAVATLNKLVQMAPQDPRWREMRAQVLVDSKEFSIALDDFDAALRFTAASEQLDKARLLAGRGLAYEGISDWVAAMKDYNEALRLAEAAGQLPDPYVINSRGNCHASLGEWRAAREDYLASAELFQTATGFQGPRGSSNPRLDGAVFAAGNAALMLAQLGDEPGATSEMKAVSRRAPGNADMRAALAALYWSQGKEGEAETEWDFACSKIAVGCSKYQDEDWLFRIRRWPPVMVKRMKSFLSLQSRAAA